MSVSGPTEEEYRQVALGAAWMNIRKQRTALLSQTDWTQFRDTPLTLEQQNAWATYRQQLRDLPANTPDPTNVTWPTPPSI
jgi:Phage tail assembly chaperone protein